MDFSTAISHFVNAAGTASVRGATAPIEGKQGRVSDHAYGTGFDRNGVQNRGPLSDPQTAFGELAARLAQDGVVSIEDRAEIATWVDTTFETTTGDGLDTLKRELGYVAEQLAPEAPASAG